MVKHLVHITLRNLLRSGFFAIGVIIGMSVTITCLIFTIAFVNKELSIDSKLKQKPIVRVLMDNPVLNEMSLLTNSDLASKLKALYPEVKISTFLSWAGPRSVTPDRSQNPFREDKILIADSNFFKVFNLDLSESAGKPLSHPSSAAITSGLAEKYFGVLSTYTGRQLEIDNRIFTIDAVIKETDQLDHLMVGILLPQGGLEVPEKQLGFTYMEVEKGTDLKVLQRKINSRGSDLLPYPVEQVINFDLQTVDQFYFHKTDFSYSYLTGVFRYQDKDVIYLVILVTGVIVALTLLNYLIFSQTRLLSMAKQVVVNRVLGQPSIQVFIGFVIEALIVLGTSSLIGLILIGLWAKDIVGLSDIVLSIDDFLNIQVLLWLFLFNLILSILMAAISFIILPRLKLLYALTGNITSSLAARKRVKLLLTLQGVLTLFFLTIVFGILTQTAFIKQYDFGFEPHNIAVVSVSPIRDKSSLVSLKNVIQNLTGIESVSISTGTPVSGRWFYSEVVNEVNFTINQIYADQDYLSLTGIKLIEGRDFNKELHSDTLSIIVNETAKRILNLKTDSTFGFYRVIGVVKDFNYNSFKESVGPVFINYFHSLTLRGQEIKFLIKLNDLSSLQKVKELWTSRYKDYDFNYFMFRDEVDKLHEVEFKRVNLLKVITGICLGISLFGSCGFSYYFVRSKRQEVAIRKTYGASSLNIGFSFCRTIIFMFGISFMLGVVPSWFVLNDWLRNYSQRIEVSFLILVTPSLVVLILSLIVASFQIIKYSRLNPVISLRYQ